MKASFRIRSMKKTDIKRLAEIYVRAYTIYDIDENWNKEKAKKTIGCLLKLQSDLAFVAENKTNVVGAFIARIKPWFDGNHLIVEEIFVDPEYHKLGIGSELSKVAYKKALDKYKVTSFEAITFAKTKFPMSWYKSQGFEVKDDWVVICGDVKTALSKLMNKTAKT